MTKDEKSLLIFFETCIIDLLIRPSSMRRTERERQKMNRRQFLIQSAKAALAVAAGVLGGVALAKKPTYEVPADEGFTAEGWARTSGWDWDEGELPQAQTVEFFYNPDLMPDPPPKVVDFLSSTCCPFTIEVQHGECGKSFTDWGGA